MDQKFNTARPPRGHMMFGSLVDRLALGESGPLDRGSAGALAAYWSRLFALGLVVGAFSLLALVLRGGLVKVLVLVAVFAAAGLGSVWWLGVAASRASGSQQVPSRPEKVRVAEAQPRKVDHFVYFRTFLSYSRADEGFGDKLYSSLFHDNGISTWLGTHQILPGDRLVESIDRGVINQTDKMVLVCSRQSLSGESSWWVNEEIELALKREHEYQRDTGETLVYLIPVTIDDYLFSDECTSPYKQTLTARHAAKFDGWQTDPNVYTTQLQRLLNALKVKPLRPGDFTTPRR